jgi:hypothetical protein
MPIRLSLRVAIEMRKPGDTRFPYSERENSAFLGVARSPGIGTLDIRHKLIAFGFGHWVDCNGSVRSLARFRQAMGPLILAWN